MRPSHDQGFPLHSQKVAERLGSLEEEVLGMWLADGAIRLFFEKYGMDGEYFKERHGYPIYRSVVDILREGGVEVSFPVIHDLIDYFKNRDVTVVDLNRFFSVFRRSLLKRLIRKEEMEEELFDEVQEILENYFHEVLSRYHQSFFSKDQALRKELNRFREYQKVIDKSAIVSKTDPNGIITYANQAFCQTTGYAYDEVIGKSHNLIRHPDTPADFFVELWKRIKSKKVFHATAKNRKKSGEMYYVDMTIVPILDEDNSIIEFIAMGYDVTQLIEAVETARIAQRVKEEFLANMSHEIRTPLNAIVGFIAILRRQACEGIETRYLDVIHDSSQMLLDIVNDILDLSKMHSGKFTIAKEPFNPMVELSRAVALFGSKTAEKSLRYAVFIDPNLPKCLIGDGSRIKQIVSNFLSNAIKFTPQNGTIKVKAVYEKGELNISVQDTGIGVSREKQATIFEAFEQADNSITRNFGGTGLGLSICSELIAQMEGRIIFRSVEKKGSLFGFHIPCGRCPDSVDDFRATVPFGTLRVTFFDHSSDPEMVILLEKYLRAFGVHQIDYSMEFSEETTDIVFCPAGSVRLDELADTSIPVVLLQKNNAQAVTHRINYARLDEPLLPDMIAETLKRAIHRP